MGKHRKQRGIIFVTSIAILAVMLIIGTGFLGVAIQQFSNARRTHNALHALAMADAGVNYTIWFQKFHPNAIPVTDARILAGTTDPFALDINGTPAPSFTVTLGSTGEDKFAVWLLKYNRQLSTGVTVKGYQAIAKGYYRTATASSYNRSVRAVLQPPPEAVPTTLMEFPQLDYVVYTESDLYINTSTNVQGNNGSGVGSNGSTYINTSSGGSINADVYSAGLVTFEKNKAAVSGNLTYGTKILDPKGKDISADVGIAVSGTVSNGATTQLVPEMKSDDYEAWAFSQGFSAIFLGTRLTTSDVVAKEILYVNPLKSPGYTLNIDCSIPKAAVVFVNGDVVINGSVKLGVLDTNTADGDTSKPFVLIATGSITCSGSPEINGIIWTKGAFGRGTPTINGGVICNNLGSFQGNPQLSFKRYAATVVPDDAINYQHAWRLASWQELR